MTVRDGYWGAKLVGSFTDAQVRAAVRAGQLPNEFAADTLAAMLNYRRDRIVEYWYARVSPIEGPEVSQKREPGSGFTLTFEDYGIRDGAWASNGTSYAWSLRHPESGRKWEGSAAAADSHRQVLLIGPGAMLADPTTPADGSLATLEITVSRRDRTSGRSATVYLRWDGDGERYRVVGLEH